MKESNSYITEIYGNPQFFLENSKNQPLEMQVPETATSQKEGRGKEGMKVWLQDCNFGIHGRFYGWLEECGDNITIFYLCYPHCLLHTITDIPLLTQSVNNFINRMYEIQSYVESQQGFQQLSLILKDIQLLERINLPVSEIRSELHELSSERSITQPN